MSTKSNASATPATTAESNTPDSKAGASNTGPATTEATSQTTSAAPRESGVAPARAGKVAPPLPYRPFHYAEAHELTAAARAAILPTAIINPGALDVPYATKVAIGAVPNIDRYRDKIAQRFDDELAEIDKIDTYARAATHALVLLSTTSTPPEKVQGVYEAALNARRFMFSDISNLVTLGFLAPQTLSEISNEPGHTNVSTDIQKLFTIAEKIDNEVEARLAISPEKRAEYQLLAYQLNELSSRRDGGGLTVEEARDNLARAVTLFVNAWEAAERVFMYELSKDQAWRTVVPSLYNNRPKSRKGNSAPETPVSAPLAVNPVSIADSSADEPIVPGARGGSPFAKNE